MIPVESSRISELILSQNLSLNSYLRSKCSLSTNPTRPKGESISSPLSFISNFCYEAVKPQ